MDAIVSVDTPTIVVTLVSIVAGTVVAIVTGTVVAIVAGTLVSVAETLIVSVTVMVDTTTLLLTVVHMTCSTVGCCDTTIDGHSVDTGMSSVTLLLRVGSDGTMEGGAGAGGLSIKMLYQVLTMAIRLTYCNAD